MRPALGGSQPIDIGSEGGDLSICKDQFNCSDRGDHSLLKARPEQIDVPNKDMQHPRCALEQLLLCNLRNERR